MTAYEYKVVKFETSGVFGGKVDENALESTLNKFGEKGWQVVGAFDTNQSNGISKYVVYTLMREKW